VFAGPLVTREALTAPRQLKHFLIRSGYVGGLFILLYTAVQATFGLQQVNSLGELARFGALMFQMISLVQMTMIIFFAVLFAAGRVSQEKDRRTLLLLLMTDLKSVELVGGKLGASLLLVGVLLAASVPVLCSLLLLGGVAPAQLLISLVLSAAAGLAAGAWGNLVAFWREKTFQTLAISVLGIVLFLGTAELAGVLFAAAGLAPLAELVVLFNPYRGLLALFQPLALEAAGQSATRAALTSAGLLGLLAASLVTTTTLRLRIWNPSRTMGEAAKSDEDRLAAPARKHREIWNNPVVWREICTRAYGRKIIFIKLAYLVLAGLMIGAAIFSVDPSRKILGMLPPAGFAFVGLGLVSMMLINAQAVTAFTSERDAGTLELLLVTNITAKEFIYGKLLGVLYNTVELLLIPLGFLLWLMYEGSVTPENFLYLMIGLCVLCTFSAMLGLHSGLTYTSSRTAITNSLGTIFFLFIGIFICLMLIVQARSSFSLQLPTFLVFILGGSLGLWVSLTHRNPSPALTLAAGILPFLTFYAITSFLLGQTLGVCLSLSAAYGFTTMAMLIPAVNSFDMALGRSSSEKG
jgi:ABC-type transport system involved in multi-copper enzyme maturation permease subunit